MTIVNKVNDKMFIYISVYPPWVKCLSGMGYILFISLSHLYPEYYLVYGEVMIFCFKEEMSVSIRKLLLSFPVFILMYKFYTIQSIFQQEFKFDLICFNFKI